MPLFPKTLVPQFCLTMSPSHFDSLLKKKAFHTSSLPWLWYNSNSSMKPVKLGFHLHLLISNKHPETMLSIPINPQKGTQPLVHSLEMFCSYKNYFCPQAHLYSKPLPGSLDLFCTFPLWDHYYWKSEVVSSIKSDLSVTSRQRDPTSSTPKSTSLCVQCKEEFLPDSLHMQIMALSVF